MRDEVLRFIRENRLLAGGERVVCAVSGGADSIALLACLCLLREELNITLAAAHFNHRLRGAESDADEAFVRDFCRARQIPLAVSGADAAAAAKARGQSVEEAARELRYGFFLSLSGVIATAHTADDNAETVLMNLLRGTGLPGLAGIPPRRGRIIRPLLAVTRPQVLEFLHGQRLSWREDSSNQTDDYRRNRLRHQVIPLLRAENPRFSETVLAESLRFRDENAYFEAETDRILTTAARGVGWDCAALAALPAALQRRALHRILAGCGAQHVEAVRRLLSGGGRTSLPGGREAVCSGGLLRIRCRAAAQPLPEAALRPGDTLRLPEAGLTIRCFLTENPALFSQSGNTFLLNYDMIGAEITVRSRRSGDAMRTTGGHRSLKRLMIDRKIPAEERMRLPVLAAGASVLAVYRIGANRDFLPPDGGRTLAVQILETAKQTEIERGAL